MEKKIFWIAVAALAFSLGTIAVLIMNAWDMSVVDSNSFISGLVALMSLVFALLVGYQIYNALEIRERLSEIDRLKEELQCTKTELQQEVVSAKKSTKVLKTELDEATYILQARLLRSSSNEDYVAFLKMISAIKCALDVNHKKDGYGWMLQELKSYMLLINNGYPFCGSPAEISTRIQAYKECFMEDDKAIRNHENFYIIREVYEPMMQEFEQRLNGIAQMKYMSLSDVGKEYSLEHPKN